MLLPFVRELFTDVEKLPAFTRVASHLKEGTGRIRVSGLTPTAKALLLVLFQRAAARPLIFVVNDNRAVEDFIPVLRGFCELTAACDPESVISLPARDVLPFQNLSPHPELQEERATALWKIATGAASIVVSPVAATAIRLRSSDYYADLARTIRRGESFDLEALLAHLNTVGYTSTDVVEMPGQYAVRGGILDVYSPEADRPLRIEFFGDEADSIRKFDPASQRSSNSRGRSSAASAHRNSGQRASARRNSHPPERQAHRRQRRNRRSRRPRRWRQRFSRLGVLLPRRRSRQHHLRSDPPRRRPARRDRSTPAGIRPLLDPRCRKPTSAAASAIWFVPRISTCRQTIGGKKPQPFPAPISNTSASPAAWTKTQSLSSRSPRRASTARFPPCSQKSKSSTPMASAFSSPSPTPAKSNAWPMSSPNTTFRFV